jgi:hypothetical protein
MQDRSNMIRFQQWLGSVMNAIGAPAFIRDTDYRSRTFGTHVRVRRGNLFTVISVNGIDVYVCRFTGVIGGIGFTQASGCIPASIRESIQSAPSPEPSLSPPAGSQEELLPQAH